MAEAKITRQSFAGGEIGANLEFAEDLAKYQISVAALENFVCLVERGASRRPGTRFVVELKTSSQRGRLLPFRLSADDYYALVVNGGVSRFVREGGVILNVSAAPYELAVPWPEGELPLLRSAVAGNQLLVASGVRPTQELTRNDHDDWDIADFVPQNGPVDVQNLDTAITVQITSHVGDTVTLQGVGNPFRASWVGQVMRLDEADLTFVGTWTANQSGMVAGNDTRRWNGNVYLLTAGTDSGPNPPTHTEGSVSSGVGYATWEYLHNSRTYIRITAASGNSASGVVLTPVPDSLLTVPTYRWYPPAWNADDGYPELLAFSTPRLLLARGDVLWESGVLDHHDLEVGVGDDEAFAYRLRSPDGSLVDIQWALPSTVMILGSSDLEWQFRAPGIFDAVTPLNVRPVPQTNEGSAPQVPALVDGGPMFVDKAGTRLLYAKFDKGGQGSQTLDTEEISVSARHIIAAGVVAMAWQKSPQRILWIVTADGALAGLTFMPQQAVLGFHRHPMTNGFVEDICVIPSTATGEDEVYLIVRRTIGGAVRRYVELLQPFFTPEDPDDPTALGAWYVDCGLRYQGAPVTTLTTLAHLEGQEVAVFADGSMQARKTVTGGAITLDYEAADVTVGLPIRGRIKDLPRNAQGQGGSTKADLKTSRELILDLKHTGGGKVRVNDGEHWEDVIETGAEGYGDTVPLFNGTKRMVAEGEVRLEAVWELVCDDAMPCTVAGMTPVLDVEEED